MGRLTSVEVLLRAKNGSDTAPYEDVLELVNPDADAETKEVYLAWKLAELVDWPLTILKAHPALQRLEGIFVNLRPLDLALDGALYAKVTERLNALVAKDKELYSSIVGVEVTEDQMGPTNIKECYKAWRELGYRLAYDDTIGDIAKKALKKDGSTNFHTISNLSDDVDLFDTVKVDIEWAGYLLFLCHPSYSFSKDKKADVLTAAREKDEVKKPAGKACVAIDGVKHSELLREFADWALKMIEKKKIISVELSVRENDENCAYTLGKLKELKLDIFGEHKDWFCFQGGLTGAKAFSPDVIAGSIVLE